ncbi:uncharacterized protein LOC107039577 isoform X1 [Diachasma alloeum]|uniref:uncharacterized protein LOC107039577 isoform X1 n=1 Tax=Diachasma alloeum TaxID=454923 RepID=UPI000738163E|nr:uncharacterized protein LOC107039577 isoform X1 [Diachasma alloeum]
MAATQNFNAHNEDMEIGLLDDTIDPDVEARLYGEIYYSNDTYPDQPGILEPPTPLNEVEPSDSSARDSPQCTKDPQPGQSRSPGLCPPQDSPPEAPQYFNRKKHRALIDGPLEFPHPFSFPRPFPMDKGHPRGPRTHDSSQRANRNDYPRENHRRRDPNPSHRPRKSRESPWRENPGREEVMEEDGEPDSTSLIALDEAMTPPEVTTPKPAELLRNNSKSPDEAPQETSNASSPPPKDEEEAPVNSKYKVLGKKSTKKILQLVTEISDSDDSILEVPVPPKPTPPLISLQDSDEESSSEEESSVVMDKSDRTSSRAKDSSSESSRSSSPEIIEDSDDTRDSSGTHEGVNLILNCTRVQKGVSSLAEIKRMRESEGKSVVEQIDEESMTESEAMNWGSLEGEMEKSQGETLKQLWQEFSEEGDLRRNFLDESGSSGKPSEEASRVSLEKTANEKSKEDGSRREKGAGEKSKEVEGRRDTPRKRALDGRTDGETPRKRTRQKENQDKEISFEEYLLQPMPKQLRDFYNEPRGGDIMRDIREIQNDMPKNPSRWMVLDSDIYPLHRKKHSVCSICQREGHVRSRCPNRPRAPTCHICGVVGHSEPRCPENKKCISCGKKYSTCRTTCEHCIRLRCSQCSGRGHTLANCPDNWRKYHQTTSGTAVNIPPDAGAILKPPNELSCCNCTRRGHDAATCMDYRWSGHFILPNYVRDYKSGPSYVSAPSPHRQAMPDLREPMNIERLGISLEGPSTYLFHFVNSSPQDTSSWKECSLVPNQLPGVDYPQPHDNPVYPLFLRTHFSKCTCAPMEVFVKRCYKLQGLPIITMRTPDDASLGKLKDLIHQWLTRPRDDKESLSHTPQLPQARLELLHVLKSKLRKFNRRAVSHQFWRKVPACLQLQKNIATSRGKRMANKDKLERKIQSLKELKLGCVVGSYKYLLIDTPLDALRRFWDFVGAVEELPEGEVPGEMYITAVWYCFELFTPHLSPTIWTSMEKWTRDPTLHVRGAKVYREWIHGVRKGIKRRRGIYSEGNAGEVVSEPGVSSGLREVVEVEKGAGNSSEGERIEQGENSEGDVEIIDEKAAPASCPAFFSSRLTLLDVWARKRTTSAGAKMGRKLAEIMRLGLPVDMPMPKDPREFSPELLAEYGNKGLEIMRQQNMSNVGRRVMKLLEGTEGMVARRGQLITMWQMIKGELVRRRNRENKRKKETFATAKKRWKKKSAKVGCLP